MHKNSTIRPLIKFSMLWYMKVMKDALMRYKLLMVFILLLVAPTAASLLKIITLPTFYLFTEDKKELYPRIFSIVGFQFLALMWFILREPILFKQPWSKYLYSLPINARQTMVYEIFLLLIIDMPLWIILLISAGERIARDFTPSLVFNVSIKCLLNIVLAIFIQIALFKKRYLWWLAIIAWDVILFLIFASSPDVLDFIFEISIIVTSSVLIISFYQYGNSNFSSISWLNWARQKYTYSSSKRTGRFAPSSLLLLQLKNHFFINKSQHILVISALFANTCMAVFFKWFGKENPNYFFLMSLFAMLNALLVSNIFPTLFLFRQNFSTYLSSLPISVMKWFQGDYMIGLMLLIICNLCLVSKFSWLEIGRIQLMPVIFLAFTYFPQIRYKRYGFMFSLAIMMGIVFLTRG